MNFILAVANISGGILLALTLLDKWDGDKDYFNKIAKVLAPFQTIIGGVILVFGVLNLLKSGNLIFDIVSIAGGFLLLTHVFGKLPSLKPTLDKISNTLMPFKAIVGIALIVVGILTLV